jgi:predicted nucleic acid-binding protein
MPGIVVDTDVVSFLFKNHPLAPQYLPHLAGTTPIISFLTVAELDRWALAHNWGLARRARMAQYLQRFVVQPWDRALSTLWAEVSVGAARAGHPIGVADAWHAATAL